MKWWLSCITLLSVTFSSINMCSAQKTSPFVYNLGVSEERSDYLCSHVQPAESGFLLGEVLGGHGQLGGLLATWVHNFFSGYFTSSNILENIHKGKKISEIVQHGIQECDLRLKEEMCKQIIYTKFGQENDTEDVIRQRIDLAFREMLKDRLSEEEYNKICENKDEYNQAQLLWTSQVTSSFFNEHPDFGGVTCCFFGCKDDVFYTANLGDVRAVLGKVENDRLVAQRLSEEHKPHVKKELQRIEKNGALVVQKDDDYCIEGVLPVSRTIGDFTFKELREVKESDEKIFTLGNEIVTSQSFINEFDLLPNYLFVIVAAQEFWRHYNDQEAVDLVNKYLEEGNSVHQAAQALKHDVVNKGASENVSIAIVTFTHDVHNVLNQLMKLQKYEERLTISYLDACLKDPSVDSLNALNSFFNDKKRIINDKRKELSRGNDLNSGSSWFGRDKRKKPQDVSVNDYVEASFLSKERKQLDNSFWHDFSKKLTLGTGSSSAIMFALASLSIYNLDLFHHIDWLSQGIGSVGSLYRQWNKDTGIWKNIKGSIGSMMQTQAAYAMMGGQRPPLFHMGAMGSALSSGVAAYSSGKDESIIYKCGRAGIISAFTAGKYLMNMSIFSRLSGNDIQNNVVMKYMVGPFLPSLIGVACDFIIHPHSIFSPTRNLKTILRGGLRCLAYMCSVSLKSFLSSLLGESLVWDTIGMALGIAFSITLEGTWFPSPMQMLFKTLHIYDGDDDPTYTYKARPDAVIDHPEAAV